MRSDVIRARNMLVALLALATMLCGCGASPSARASNRATTDVAANTAGATSAPTARVSTPNQFFRVTQCQNQSPVSHAGSATPPPTSPTIYIGGEESLTALTRSNGTIAWCDHFAPAEADTCPPTISCPLLLLLVGGPLVADGVLYVCVSGQGGYTVALNAADGELRWYRKTDCLVASIPFQDPTTPVLADGLLYSGGYALDPRDGTPRWQLPDFTTPGLISGGTLYAYSEDTVYAFNAPSGAPLWTYKLSNPIGSVPAIASGVLYVGDYSLGVTALDARTGRVLWQATTGHNSGSPLIANGMVYVGGDALYALDATTGRVRWQRPSGPGNFSTPLLSGGVVYFTNDAVYALNATTGALIWRQPLGASLSTSYDGVSASQGLLYTLLTDGQGQSTLYALSMANGSIVWRRGGLKDTEPPVVAGS